MVKTCTDNNNTIDKIKVFVSSTISNLKDLRSSLYERLYGWGLDPIAFEAGSIVINPSKDVIDECIKAASECSIFILIISGKFGNEYKNENISITWKEYRTAKENNAVIIPFIREDVLAIKKFIEEYKNELNEHLTKERLIRTEIIDDARIIEFVEEIQKNSEGYLPYSTIEDLIPKLRNRLQHLFDLPIGKIDYIFDLLRSIIQELKWNIETSDIILGEMTTVHKTAWCFKNSSVNYLVDRGLFLDDDLGLEIDAYTRFITIANNFLLRHGIVGHPDDKKNVIWYAESVKERSMALIKKIEERISRGFILSTIRRQ
ncbi:MAG: DUF4062 domain-containing protein [archaeon]|nr:DUF4062 domain-containing protein [archaeon]